MDSILDSLDIPDTPKDHLELDAGTIAGLKKMPVDIFEGIYLSEAHNNALILCVDVRNFSEFLCSSEDEEVFKLIKEFTLNLLSCINHYGYGCSYYKFMGDGALVIWDETNENNIKEALDIFNTYCEFLDEDLFKQYGNLGMGGALVEEKVFKYEISAELSRLKFRDYIGYGLNLASRLQTLAKADELILNGILAETRTILYRVDESPEQVAELKQLKGLMERDRSRVLFYERSKK